MGNGKLATNPKSNTAYLFNKNLTYLWHDPAFWYSVHQRVKMKPETMIDWCSGKWWKWSERWDRQFVRPPSLSSRIHVSTYFKIWLERLSFIGLGLFLVKLFLLFVSKVKEFFAGWSKRGLSTNEVNPYRERFIFFVTCTKTLVHTSVTRWCGQ